MERVLTIALLVFGVVLGAVVSQRPWADTARAAVKLTKDGKGPAGQFDCLGFGLTGTDDKVRTFTFNPPGSGGTATVKQTWRNDNGTVVENRTFPVGSGSAHEEAIDGDGDNTNATSTRVLVTSGPSVFVVGYFASDNENGPNLACVS